MVQKYVLGVVALAAISISNPASAGAIDGHWCHAASGKHLRIDGPAITTPGGKKFKAIMTGTDFATSFPSLSRRPARP